MLEGFPRSRVEAETMIKNDFYVDALVIARCSSEVCCRRNILQREKLQRESQTQFTGLDPLESELIDRYLSITYNQS